MPEISRFLGIVIAMFYRDHAPPHFHARYGEHEITVRIDDGVADGPFPLRARGLVLEWHAYIATSCAKIGSWPGPASLCGRSSHWSSA